MFLTEFRVLLARFRSDEERFGFQYLNKYYLGRDSWAAGSLLSGAQLGPLLYSGCCFLPVLLAFAWEAPEDGGAGHTSLRRALSPFQLVVVTLKTTQTRARSLLAGWTGPPLLLKASGLCLAS